MRGRYLLEAPTELLDAGKAHAKKEGVSFAELLRTALGKEIGTERLAEPDQGSRVLGDAADARKAAPVPPTSGSVSPLVPSLPAPKVERCGFRNPLVPAQKCVRAAGHEGRHAFA